MKKEGKRKLLQNILIKLQLHSFFESYIQMIIEQKFNCEVIANPLILVNPSFYKDIINGYLEMDGLILKTNTDDLIIIECKNSFYVGQKQGTQFIGKSLLIEQVYDLRIKKILVSTGTCDYFWRNINVNDFNIYDISDYRNNYSDLLSFLNLNLR